MDCFAFQMEVELNLAFRDLISAMVGFSDLNLYVELH